VLVFTSEEVWGTRFPGGGSVHLLEWPEIPTSANEGNLKDKWELLRVARNRVYGVIEPLRRDKELGSSLEARVRLAASDLGHTDWLTSVDLPEVFITSDVDLSFGKSGGDTFLISVARTANSKCGRCWRHLPEVDEDGDLCARCTEVVGG
jgi:isoleucyl-tRNA synthetase